MKVLMINKFLYPNGGSETYIFKLGQCLCSHGHKVEYFGMEHSENCVGNRCKAYTANMDFHTESKFSKIAYSFKLVYSAEARRKIRQVLNDFEPDICHLNNFNYQLTPSIILEIVKWRKQTGHRCKIVFTAHDYQLICPNHMCHNPNTNENCERCLSGRFIECLKGKCIHGSRLKSSIGMMEAYFWKLVGVYSHIDCMICCSKFMKQKMDSNPIFAQKTVVIRNFIDNAEQSEVKKKEYILYFGRFSIEKGIDTLVEVCKELPDIPFVFAGNGPLEEKIREVSNIKLVGFKSGIELERLIREAKFTVYPSEWYENCPFSVMESQMYGTPVLGADIGGIPELINTDQTGELFESGNKMDLKKKIEELWTHPERIERYKKGCKSLEFDTVDEYYKKVMEIYG